MVNAHDGEAAYRFLAGYFRVVCSNGLVTGDITAALRVPHLGDVLSQVLTVTYRIAEESEAMVQVIDAMRQILLTIEEQRLLAQFAIDIRYPLPANVEERDLAPARPSSEDFLRPKRDQDRGQSLWTTYNVIQEWMMVGGIRMPDGRRTRPIGGIDQGLQLNSALWMEAQRLLTTKR